MVRNMYILWDMIFVICMGIIGRYFVGHESYIYIYIYIFFFFWETWNLKMYERYVWVFCGEYIWIIIKCCKMDILIVKIYDLMD